MRGAVFMPDLNQKINDAINTPDETMNFDPADIQTNQTYCIFAYLSWLVLIPLLAAPNSRYAKYHSNQGILLAIAGTVGSTVLGVLGLIPFVGLIFSIILGLYSAIILVFAVIGIIHVINGQARPLPLIGGFKLIDYDKADNSHVVNNGGFDNTQDRNANNNGYNNNGYNNNGYNNNGYNNDSNNNNDNFNNYN